MNHEETVGLGAPAANWRRQVKEIEFHRRDLRTGFMHIQLQIADLNLKTQATGREVRQAGFNQRSISHGITYESFHL